MIGSFGFVDQEHVLLGTIRGHKPLLQVINFKKSPNEVVSIEEADYACVFHCPPLRPEATTLAISVRSDPAPGWEPNPALQVPFYTAPKERLFAITIWISERAVVHTLLLFIPFSTITSRLVAPIAEGHGRDFGWDEWGPNGSRLMKAPGGHSMVWVCYISGTSWIGPQYTPEYEEPPIGPKAIQILDFNQLAIRRDSTQGDHSDVTEVNLTETVLELDDVFLHTVTTRLPYRKRTINVPRHQNSTYNAVMLNEDSIVTVTSVCLNMFV